VLVLLYLTTVGRCGIKSRPYYKELISAENSLF